MKCCVVATFTGETTAIQSRSGIDSHSSSWRTPEVRSLPRIHSRNGKSCTAHKVTDVSAMFTTSRRRISAKATAPSAAKNGSPPRNDMAMASALSCGRTFAIAHHSTSGNQANVARLLLMSSSDIVGPQNISASAAASAAPLVAKRLKRSSAPHPTSMTCSARKRFE